MSFVNNLDPNQAWQNVATELSPNCLTGGIHGRIFLKTLILKKKNQQTPKSMKNYPACILPIIFVLKMFAYYICCIYSNAPQTRFFHGGKQYEP